ncbi:MAG TPA: type II CAAX endopeptidase family protein [Alphaproteobacteria bacterium]|nr:type II CAAX endopeptidase family protein [Alphaproteobacteria bacterium]
MSLTHSLVLLASISCFLVSNRLMFISLLVLCNVAAFFQGLMDIYGFFSLLSLSGLCFLKYRLNHHKLLNFLLNAAIFSFSALLFLHLVPGFENQVVLDAVIFSPRCNPFTMYFSYDKIMTALIVYAMSDSYAQNVLFSGKKVLKRKHFFLTGALLIACISFLLIPGLLANFIKIDFTIPNVWALWALNNLFFVCVGEEIFFRNYLLRDLRISVGLKPVYALLLSSVVFGLFHYNGGAIYMVLAALAGIFYGYCYLKTQKILYPILLHFGLNLVHFAFFTYPSAARVFY